MCQWRNTTRNWNSFFTCLLNSTYLGRIRATTTALFRQEMHVLVPEPLSFLFAMIHVLLFLRESVHVVRKSKISYKQYEFLFPCFSFLVQLVNWYYELWKPFAPRFLLVGMGCISYFKQLLREAEAQVSSHQTFHSVTNLSIFHGTLRNCSLKSDISLQLGAQYAFSRLVVFLACTVE